MFYEPRILYPLLLGCVIRICVIINCCIYKRFTILTILNVKAVAEKLPISVFKVTTTRSLSVIISHSVLWAAFLSGKEYVFFVCKLQPVRYRPERLAGKIFGLACMSLKIVLLTVVVLRERERERVLLEYSSCLVRGISGTRYQPCVGRSLKASDACHQRLHSTQLGRSS